MKQTIEHNKQKSSKKRLIVFGIDGATWEIIEIMSRKDKLPNFKKLMDNGVYGDLRSVNPPVTCPAWATMFTGKSAASLGVFHFFKPTAEYDLKLSTLMWNKWRPIWDILSDLGKIVYVFNVPTTTAYSINGKFISGPIWGEQEGVLAYPKKLNDELIRKKYQIRTDISNKVSGDEVYIRDITRITENKFKVMYELFKESNWDLLIMTFYYCDQIQHRYWKYINSKHPKYKPNSRFSKVIFDHYKLLDNYLGKILNNLPDNTSIFVTSDHGHEPTHTYVNINAWLYHKKYLHYNENFEIGQKNGLKKRINNSFLRMYYYLTQSYSKFIYFGELKNKRSLISLAKKFKNWSYVLENKFSNKYPLKKNIDWERTQAYSIIFNTIFLNRLGREAKGYIDDKDLEKLKKNIKKELVELKDPETNDKVIKNVWTKEQLYVSKAPQDFPEIYIQFNRGYRNYFSELHNPIEIFSKEFKGSTEHYLDGIFLAYGPDFEVGKKIEDVKLEDIVPTMLHILNYPIPLDMDGEVLKEIFQKDSELKTRSIKFEKELLITPERSKIRGIKFSKKI
jgi:predicted AlkP superfamily phosphohydrolase/phosphomutase